MRTRGKKRRKKMKCEIDKIDETKHTKRRESNE